MIKIWIADIWNLYEILMHQVAHGSACGFLAEMD
jgi:hypothetical protein